MPGPVFPGRPALQVCPRGKAAAAGKPAQVHGKAHHRHQADPEARHGIQHQHPGRQQPVGPAPRTAGHGHAGSHARGQCNGPGRKHQLQGARQTRGDQPGHGGLIAQRLAQVQPRQPQQIVGQLREQALVQPESGPPLRHQLGRGAARLGGQHIRRVAGHQLQQQEVEDDDAQHRRQGLGRQAAQAGQQAEGGRHGRGNAGGGKTDSGHGLRAKSRFGRFSQCSQCNGRRQCGRGC